MFSDANLPEPNWIYEIENPPLLTNIDEKDGIFFCDEYTQERRIRYYVYNMLLRARQYLPAGYYFKIYEAYRPLASQKKLWESVVSEQQKKYPHMKSDSEEFIALCDVYCANPYRQGSGHQSGAAIDVTLCNQNGLEYDMGGCVRGFTPMSDFDWPVDIVARRNRFILKESLQKVGFVNYPSEWWHYSFGDRLWARLTGSSIAIFARLDI